MIDIKTEKEIEIMWQGGKILAEVLFEVSEHAKSGVTEIELDSLAERLIKEKGAEPGFKKVKGYCHAICTSTNDVVVHGIPTKYQLKEGDIIGIDCGVYYKGYYTDMAETIRIKDKGLRIKEDKVYRFLETGKRALMEAINVAKVGNRIGHISKNIQKIIEGQGYSVVRSLVGHGVGKSLHEEPEVPGFLAGSVENTPKLLAEMVIAIEVIYNMGKPDVVYSNDDGWTIKTKDGSLSGLFERTVAITKDMPMILTQ
ncbi:MAG: type I methionyl aminopeptidase [Patescibacteria group bacterium]